MDNNIAYGLMGVIAGASVHLWTEKRRLEQRCEFMDDLKSGVLDAFEASDRVLANKRTPQFVRDVLLFLLAAHADAARGKRLTALILEKPLVNKKADDAADLDIQRFVQSDPSLARVAHRAVADLLFGLVFIHHADEIRIEKIQDEAARDPSALWSRVGRLLGRNGDGGSSHSGGIAIPA